MLHFEKYISHDPFEIFPMKHFRRRTQICITSYLFLWRVSVIFTCNRYSSFHFLSDGKIVKQGSSESGLDNIIIIIIVVCSRVTNRRK